MSSDPYLSALAAHDRLKLDHGSGAAVISADGGAAHLLGPAIHSESLTVLLVLIDLQGGLEAIPAERVAPRAGPALGRDMRPFRRMPFRHRKGGLYDRLAARVDGPDGPLTLYVQSSGGPWWLRPSAMFEDGRFTPLAPYPVPGTAPRNR